MGAKPRQQWDAVLHAAKRAATRRSVRHCKMAVGDQPICTEDEFRRIDPVWMPGPVPARFWETATTAAITWCG